MTKKCSICEAPAIYQIKDTNDFYCDECAQDNFADLTVLLKVEEEAQKLKKYLDEHTDEDLGAA